MKYLASTFSPMMLDEKSWANAEVVPIELNDIPSAKELNSIVSHEITAKILSALLNEIVEFNRINITLFAGDVMYCVIPGFRTTEAREFSYEEVAAAGWRCFLVTIN